MRAETKEVLAVFAGVLAVAGVVGELVHLIAAGAL
jgi:hypothetical protein